MASVLVIGVGSTGLAAMEYAQQFYYEFTQQNSSNNVAFMFIETDEHRKARTVSNGETAIEACYITPKRIEATLDGWYGRYDWMPSASEIIDLHNGAGGKSAFGRIALWSEEYNVRSLIASLYRKINGNDDTNIYLIGSLTGGTGTGIFLDVAYMIKQITQNEKLYGMFMLPNYNKVGKADESDKYENSYVSLKSLDKFSFSQEKFKCTLPGGIDISSEKAPFKNVQFFTQDFYDGSASITDVATLSQSVGFNLVLRLLDVTNQEAPFEDWRWRRIKDYSESLPRGTGIFTSVGFNVFQYPESMMEEYLTTKLLHEYFLNRWTDANNYIDNKNGKKNPIQGVLQTIKGKTNIFVQEAISESIEACQGLPALDKPTFKQALESEINIILSKSYNEPSEENYIYNLLSPESVTPNLYLAIQGQSTELCYEMVEKISKHIEDVSTKYQNLTIIKEIIDYIGEAIESVLEDWKRRYRIDGTSSQWNNVWDDTMRDRFKNASIYSMLLSNRELYFEALFGAAKMCYFNVFIPELKRICDSLLSRNKEIILTSNGVKLPSINAFNLIQEKVNELMNTSNAISLVAREYSLKGQLSMNNNPQIYYLFQGNTIDEDVKKAEVDFSQYKNRLDISKLIEGSGSLWKFLDTNDVETIKSEMIKKGGEIIEPLRLFANNDVVNIMKNLPKSHPAYNKVQAILDGRKDKMQSDTPAMVRLCKTKKFEPHQNLLLTIISDKTTDNASGIVNAITKGNGFDINNDNYVQIPSMKNTVVVYQEYGYLGVVNNVSQTFNPLIHLIYQEQVRQLLEKKINDGNFDDSVRLAYISRQELIDSLNIKDKSNETDIYRIS